MRLTAFDRAQLTPGTELPRVDVTGEITKQMRMPRDPSPVVRRARRKALPDTGPQKVARRALRKMGGCRESLARELGANRCTLNRWLRGVANPKASTLKALKELADGPPRKNRKAMIADLVAAALAACGTQKALAEVVDVLTQGAEKYAPGNWQHVDDAGRRYLAASLRHELALARGQTTDPETYCHHLAHTICCDLFRLELALRSE